LWVSDHVKTIKPDRDEDVPAWIKEWDEYEANNFDFDDESRILLVRLAYYLGESFVREFEVLSWAVGAWDSAAAGQPVVSGFNHEIEMAVLMVAENFVRTILTGEGTEVRLNDSIAGWIELLP
jgi:hypothetical protein